MNDYSATSRIGLVGLELYGMILAITPLIINKILMTPNQIGTLLLIGVVLFISTIFGIGTTHMNDSHYIPRSKRSKVISEMKNIYGPIVQQTTIFQQRTKSMWIVQFITSCKLHKKAISNRLPQWMCTGIQLTSDHTDQYRTEVITTLTRWYTTLHNKAKLAWTSKQKHRILYGDTKILFNLPQST